MLDELKKQVIRIFYLRLVLRGPPPSCVFFLTDPNTKAFIKIYDYEGFPNPARVRIALSEKGATDKIQFVHVDVMKGEHRLPAFISKNPSASVPVLELDDGTSSANARASPNI
ncbi:glutathione S-transferase N-terminal domain-containing protein [Massilia sp. CMS3.1]|uniref:glutathione S-transferase N-terminal domain-containing protein n=1 Tax=Massilia sp. CMS3.1 TaxID=3373083 RepID=UPI003EE61CCE